MDFFRSVIEGPDQALLFALTATGIGTSCSAMFGVYLYSCKYRRKAAGRAAIKPEVGVEIQNDRDQVRFREGFNSYRISPLLYPFI